MRVDLDAKVRTRDGEDAGSVDRAVFDPHRQEVTHFVIHTGGFLGRDVLVPREDLERATPDGDALRLQLSKAELERLPSYAPADYVAPPPGWIAPASYGFPTSAWTWPAAYPYPFPGVAYPLPAGGMVPGAPDTAGAPAPASGDDVAQPTLNKGAVVVDREGADIGEVDDVYFDRQTGKLQGFMLRIGGALVTMFGGGEHVHVYGDQVEQVSEQVVRLKLSKDELKAFAHRAQR
jgi:sporulation protein YlmC with PRC-barrel domain